MNRGLTLLLVSLPAFAQLPRTFFSGGLSNSGGVVQGRATFQVPQPPIQLLVNAPFSGQDLVESAQTLADGSHVTQPSRAGQKVWRDSQGRIRVETSLLGGGPLTQAKGSVTLVEILDPTTSAIFIMDDITRVVHRVKATVVQPRNVEQGLTAALPPALPNAPKLQTSTQDLGTQTMQGVLAHGLRTTTVIPPGARGNDGPLTTSRETWYSPDLNLILSTAINGGTGATSTNSVANLSRNEPDPALFTIPLDYKLVDESATFTIVWGKK